MLSRFQLVCIGKLKMHETAGRVQLIPQSGPCCLRVLHTAPNRNFLQTFPLGLALSRSWPSPICFAWSSFFPAPFLFARKTGAEYTNDRRMVLSLRIQAGHNVSKCQTEQQSISLRRASQLIPARPVQGVGSRSVAAPCYLNAALIRERLPAAMDSSGPFVGSAPLLGPAEIPEISGNDSLSDSWSEIVGQ